MIQGHGQWLASCVTRIHVALASVKLQLAVQKPEFSRADQPPVGDADPVKRSVEIAGPEMEELPQPGKSRRQIVFLPDKGLKQAGMIGHVIKDFRRRRGGIRVAAR